MAQQKALVIVNGQVQQIAAGDVLPPAELGTGTPDGTKFLRDDGTWQPINLADVLAFAAAHG